MVLTVRGNFDGFRKTTAHSKLCLLWPPQGLGSSFVSLLCHRFFPSY